MAEKITVDLSIGEVMKIYRDAEHLSQAEFAKRLGISRNYVSILERGESMNSVSWGVMKRIIKAMGFRVVIETAPKGNS